MDDMTSHLTRDELRGYAGGTLGWATLRSRGMAYGEVLAGLGELSLRPPLAPMEGPNVEARKRGRRRLRELLARPRP
jgi:hypothetical protein